MRVLFDANVWISANQKPGSVCGQALAACGRYDLDVCISRDIMDEIERVLRLKFKWPAPEARDAAFYARETSELIMAGGQNAWPGLPDLNDAHVLDTVVFGGIDIVVTGDKKLKAYGASALKVQFMDPRQFIETYA